MQEQNYFIALGCWQVLSSEKIIKLKKVRIFNYTSSKSGFH
jgi:hypothetical protein